MVKFILNVKIVAIKKVKFYRSIFYHFFLNFYIKYYHREFNEGIYYYVL